MPPCAEMQARYYALLLSGKRAQPSAAAIDASVRADAKADLEQFPFASRDRTRDAGPALPHFLLLCFSLAPKSLVPNMADWTPCGWVA